MQYGSLHWIVTPCLAVFLLLGASCNTCVRPPLAPGGSSADMQHVFAQAAISIGAFGTNEIDCSC